MHNYHHDLPVLLVGGSAGAIKGGRRYPDHTPLANLHLTLLDKMGVSIENLGNSTGKLAELSEVATTRPTPESWPSIQGLGTASFRPLV